MSLSLVIIAFQEEDRIGGCLRAAAGLASEVVLVDSFSSDDTVARALAEVPALVLVRRQFDTAARQMNAGIEHATGDWILLLDCDERVTEPMRAEIALWRLAPESLAGVFFPRRNFVFGRWLRHGGNYPDYNHARLIRRGRVYFLDHPVHPRQCFQGETAHGRAPLDHLSYSGLRAYFEKFNRYTDGEAEAMAAAGRRYSTGRMLLESFGHLARRGLAQQAFRDGAAGVIYLVLGFFYDLVRHWKLRELTRPFAADAAGAVFQKSGTGGGQA